MKKLFTLLLTVLMSMVAVFAVGCSGESDSSVVDPRKGNTIVVGYTVYEPMNYTEDKVLVGFDTELAIMTFEALGYNVKLSCITWGNKYVELNEGTIDCIWNGFTSNGEDDPDGDGISTPRDQLVAFSYNYMQNAQCIIRKASTPAITDPAQFDGTSVAVERGSSGDSLASSYKTDDVDIRISALDSQMDAVTEVNEGTCKYAIVDVLLAEAILAGGGYDGLVINQGLEIAVEYYAIGFKKDSAGCDLRDKVNMTLEYFAQTGYLQALADKYNLSTAVITDFSAQK